mmetsp:Transcript_122187/g.356712  ORF Transcript_122187/g.356712 Transcript_122187/m.356712 type:complete len:302 (-) Transcript_122187:1020-1925(-)
MHSDLQRGHCADRWNHLARQSTWKKWPQRKDVRNSPRLYASRQMAQFCCSAASKRTCGRARISSSERRCPVRTVPSWSTLRTLRVTLSSSSRFSLARRANMPVMPSRPTSMVRADCWALSERTVEVLLWTVSPSPQTEPVSSRRSRSRSCPRSVGGRWEKLGEAGESMLRGLSKPTTETTPSSSSVWWLWLPAWGLTAAEAKGVVSMMAASSSRTRSSSSLASREIATGLEAKLASATSSVTLAPEPPEGLRGPSTEEEIVLMLLAVFIKERSAMPPPENPPKRRPKSFRRLGGPEWGAGA